jgi:tetratricopeptide (TPR) repeat protein
MGNLETALEKANEGMDQKLEKDISKELVRVYQIIANDFQEQGDFDKALQFFEKCLTATKQAKNREQEAECYQKMGHIYEKLGDLGKAIELLDKFLAICDEENSPEGK